MYWTDSIDTVKKWRADKVRISSGGEVIGWTEYAEAWKGSDVKNIKEIDQVRGSCLLSEFLT